MRQFRVILVYILFYNSSGYTQEILINEYLASNVIAFPEMYDFDDYSDWIELYNPSPEPFSLNGFFLTDYSRKNKQSEGKDMKVKTDNKETKK